MFLFGKKEEEPISGQLEIDLIISVRKAIDKTVAKMFEIKLEEKPKIEQHPTIQWEGKFKVSKPSDCVFCSTITIERENHDDNGIVVLFIPESIAEIIAGGLGISLKQGEEGVMKGCGQFLEAVVEYFTKHLVKLGYEELKFSEPYNFSHKVDQLFDYHRSKKYVLTFSHKGEKFVQVEMGIGPLRKNQ